MDPPGWEMGITVHEKSPLLCFGNFQIASIQNEGPFGWEVFSESISPGLTPITDLSEKSLLIAVEVRKENAKILKGFSGVSLSETNENKNRIDSCQVMKKDADKDRKKRFESTWTKR